MRLKITGADLAVRIRVQGRKGGEEEDEEADEEIVVVVDDEDDEEGEKKAKLPTSLDQALATAFSLNLANPNVTAKASTSAQA